MNSLSFFFTSRRRNTRSDGDWDSAVCFSNLGDARADGPAPPLGSLRELHHSGRSDGATLRRGARRARAGRRSGPRTVRRARLPRDVAPVLARAAAGGGGGTRVPPDTLPAPVSHHPAGPPQAARDRRDAGGGRGA